MKLQTNLPLATLLVAAVLTLTHSGNTIANQLECTASALSIKLAKEYAKGGIDTSAYAQLDENAVKAMLARSKKVSSIHERTKDMVHSYSITLYKTQEDCKFYLVYGGGFGGNDIFGFGPVAE